MYRSNSMEPTSSSRSLQASQDHPKILCNPKFRYRDHKNTPLVHILSQINLVHATPSYLFHNYLAYVANYSRRVLLMSLHAYTICRGRQYISLQLFLYSEHDLKSESSILPSVSVRNEHDGIREGSRYIGETLSSNID
jgi:hypothetical protein